MLDRNTAIPAAYLFLERDGKYLIARRLNTGYQDGNYNVPSGHVEVGELPVAALIRESKEEVGIDIKPEDVEFFHAAYRLKSDDTGNRADYFFLVRRWSGEPQNMEPNKCDDLRWVAISDLPENTVPHVREAFAALEKHQLYQEFDLEWMRSHGYKVTV